MSMMSKTYHLYRVPLIVNTEDDVLTASSTQNSSVVPVFCVSSVTGRGLDLLTSFLHVLPPGVSHKEKQRLDQVSIRVF